MRARILAYLAVVLAAVVIDWRTFGPPPVFNRVARVVTDDPLAHIEPVQEPLADSLIDLFKGMSISVSHNRPDIFQAFLHPEAEGELLMRTRSYGFESLMTYLRSHAGDWPDPDTLVVSDVVADSTSARLTLVGPGRHWGSGPERLRYTFLLFRQSDKGWRLLALSSLEKERTDPYGYPISYHETELPPSLRFPRAF
ncbi:hypothetical protein GF420_03240 [candidate division GN15 bacterium]|nr:hypothetical protein [candidate division GN15 bacterium]